ncbi:hypothetical protein QCA50_014467 [Cerrena zonata]|uniref:Uncharacterized protein n=1 Tax=Cerrena zonata TaxID=2478898 RepID=A0AAW0FT83_9APHY
MHQVPEGQWCCIAHCEEHGRLLIEYQAINGKVAALRNKAVRLNDVRSLRTIQEVSIALDEIHELIDVIDEGIKISKRLHDKFCWEHAMKDGYRTSINRLKAQRVPALQIMFGLSKKLRSLGMDDCSIVTQPPQYTPVDPMVLPKYGCSAQSSGQPSSSQIPLMYQGSDYSIYDSTDN